jgi:hypothetical protein
MLAPGVVMWKVCYWKSPASPCATLHRQKTDNFMPASSLRIQAPCVDAIDSPVGRNCSPNTSAADVHYRMPVILAPKYHDRWLDPSMQDVALAVGLLAPFDSNLMRRYPVSIRVNLVANDDAECSVPVALPAATATLFD